VDVQQRRQHDAECEQIVSSKDDSMPWNVSKFYTERRQLAAEFEQILLSKDVSMPWNVSKLY